jgi:transcriptional regulator with XRE-family HTH domain
MNIGERLKIVRNLYGFSPVKVAEGIGIKQVTYQSYERSRAETPVRVLLALSKFYYGIYSIDLMLDLRSDTEYGIIGSYQKATPENRKIVDFILNTTS